MTQKFYVATQSRAAIREIFRKKTFISRHIIRVFKLQGTKELSRDKIVMSRQLQDRYAKLRRNILEVCRDIIIEKGHRRGLRQNTTSHKKVGEQR